MLKCHFKVIAPKPPKRVQVKRPYPHSPRTLGDFILKKRLDLKLTQKQVADKLNTSVCNIRHWEANKGQISLRFHPKVIDFIGFCPFDASLLLGKRLKERRENFGLSIKELARLLEIDPCTIASWERETHQPSQKSRNIIESFLKASNPEKILFNNYQSSSVYGNLIIVSFPKYIIYSPHWTIGRKINVWRTSAGLSQRKLAELSGFSSKTILRWEKDIKTPKTKNLQRLLQTIISYVEYLCSIKRI